MSVTYFIELSYCCRIVTRNEISMRREQEIPHKSHSLMISFIDHKESHMKIFNRKGTYLCPRSIQDVKYSGLEPKNICRWRH